MARRKQVTAADILSAYQQASPQEREQFLYLLAESETEEPGKKRHARLLAVLFRAQGSSGRILRKMIDGFRREITQREEYIRKKLKDGYRPRPEAKSSEKADKLRGPEPPYKHTIQEIAQELDTSESACRKLIERQREWHQLQVQYPFLTPIFQELYQDDFK